MINQSYDKFHAVPWAPGIDKIICLGNTSTATAEASKRIATQFFVPFNGPLEQANVVNNGCYYTSIHYASGVNQTNLTQWRMLADQADLIVQLDQPLATYTDPISYYKNSINARWFSHFKPVIIENSRPDLYITQWYQPQIQFNTELVHCDTNTAIEHELISRNIHGRRVFLQFANIQQQPLDEFKALINRVVAHCRKNSAQFVIMRGGQHEPEHIHYEITYWLADFPEFVLLADQAGISQAIAQHWKRLYKL